jgi:uncharacterized membrane protein (DUF485 family)
MLHENKQILGTDNAAQKKAKLGVLLFFIYTFIYSGFVAIGLSKPEWMGLESLGGQNLAVVYGFGLIILAIIMGFVYNTMCTRMENEMNQNA